MKNKKRVDIVIPTYKPDDRFVELLHRLLRQTYPVQSIFVINTKSDVFPEEVKRLDKVSVTEIQPEEFDHGGTRNQGAAMSDAEIIMFMTQDAMPADEHLIEELVKALDPPGDRIGAAYARQLPSKECKVIERYTRAFNYPDESRIKSIEDTQELGIKTFFCSNVCAAYSKEVYDKMGGFVLKAIFNEDMIFAGCMVKAGYKIAYAAQARVIHSHNYSGVQQFHRNFDLAVSQAEHPEVFDGIKSESEGIRLVKQTAGYLFKIRKPYLIFDLIYKSGCKYVGYKLGHRYRKLPLWFVKKCSMSRTYWEKKAETVDFR